MKILDLSKIDTVIFKEKAQSRWVKIWKLNFGNTFNAKNPKKGKTPQAESPKTKQKTIHLTDADVGSTYKIAECCQPIPGDPVLGFLDDSGTVVVHKLDCPTAQKLKSSYGNRILTAQWATHKVLSFLTTIEISGLDEVGMLRRIVKIVTDDYNINIKSINIDSKDGVFNGQLAIYVYSTEDINLLCMNLLKVSAIKSVKRIS